MDAFLAKLSYHATNYAIRSCLALTSTYVIQQGSRLLKTVDDDPLRAELSRLQRRLARKVELISPIIDTIEFRSTRGDSALETVARTARELREEIDALAKRLENAAEETESTSNGARRTKSATPAARRAELLNIISDIKELIVSIDDSIPLINLWVSTIGGMQAQQSSSFSPSRLLQASMLVTVGDSQYVLDPSQPMQIGPDFTLSLYMLFRAHASSQEEEEPYGVEEGQRKPMWQEVIHKARVRLYRVPVQDDSSLSNGGGYNPSYIGYSYRLEVVEDLDDGRVHSFGNGEARPSAYNGILIAGIREFIPVHQISKMFYANVGKILNIHNEEGASSNPVLLLKRDPGAVPVTTMMSEGMSELNGQSTQRHMLENADDSILSEKTLSEGDSQDDIDRQLMHESKAAKSSTTGLCKRSSLPAESSKESWRLPPDLDPEWIALEVFESDDDDDDDNSTPDEEDDDDGESLDRHTTTTNSSNNHHHHHPPRPTKLLRPAADSNLVTQLSRMNLASSSASRPSSSQSHSSNSPSHSQLHHHPPHHPHPHPHPRSDSELLLERSPFGAIRTSLSLLEMLLRLASLQEFEQTTHLAIPDHVLQFYLDQQNQHQEPGVRGGGGGGGRRDRDRDRWAEAERRVGFDPGLG
ncbi:RanGTP-binding protein-domain-containing protein [Biscogniauxia mediterranea]|nr:RanGTP-binding protein-domain-containing protein [Biscogniauxia mediterranea]